MLIARYLALGHFNLSLLNVVEPHIELVHHGSWLVHHVSWLVHHERSLCSHKMQYSNIMVSHDLLEKDNLTYCLGFMHLAHVWSFSRQFDLSVLFSCLLANSRVCAMLGYLVKHVCVFSQLFDNGGTRELN